MFKDVYYKKYLKYKNKYIDLQSQLGGYDSYDFSGYPLVPSPLERQNAVVVSSGPPPNAINENDDISVPLRPFRQNATSGGPVDVSSASPLVPPQLGRQNATSGRPVDVSSAPPLVPPPLGRQNATSGRPVDVSSGYPLFPPPLGRQNAVDVSSGYPLFPPPLRRQYAVHASSGPPNAISENEIDTVPIIPFRLNATRGIRARIPSVSSIGPPPLVRQHGVDVSSGHLPDAISSENNYTFVPLPSYSQNTTRVVSARIPSAPFVTSSPATNASATSASAASASTASASAASASAASGPAASGPAASGPTDSASAARAASAAARAARAATRAAARADPNDAP
jgi:hypothetical protein